MTTESNQNNFTSNISKTNGDIMTENNSKEVKSEKTTRLDEFAKPKKVYYLASCDENIGMLKKGQEKDLTDILLSLKKEYDNIKMESKKITDETERLEKKINIIKQMDSKTEKNNIESKFDNENIKKAIEATKERLKEEEYKKKTLTALLTKIKKDINLNEITLQKSYDRQNILSQKLEKEKLLQNEIKAKGNQINNLINMQKNKNEHDLKEYNLQVKYYNTIIEQKMDFIKAAEERKERQAKIAQDAKKTSGDKDENEKREKLELLYLINNYLQKKMENELEKNKEIEDAFSKIRLTCGTSNLKAIIEKILLKDKKYNYTLKKINEKEQEKRKLTKEIEELQKTFTDLKNEIVIDVDSVNKKDIQIIKSKDLETTINNENLLNEEIALNEKYNLNKELNNLVNLRYDQVINSLRKLCTEESINYMKDVSLNASKIMNLNKSTSNIINQSTINKEEQTENKTDKEIKESKAEEEGQDKELEQEEKEMEENEDTNQKGTSNISPSKEESLKKKITSQDDKEKLESNTNEVNRQSQEETNKDMNIVDNVENNEKENEEGNIKETNNFDSNNINTNTGNANNSGNINNSNINISVIGSMSVLDQEEEKKLIKAYKEYLIQAEKTIDALFLMKTKNDFLQMVRDKASEFDDANKTLKIIKKVQDMNKKNKKSISKSVSMKNNLYGELEYCADDNESTKEKELQDKIFRTYMNAERKKMERFINNEKEGKTIKKSN
jgi:hypothetical protein